MSGANGMLANLLSRGDKVFIDIGQLVIEPSSGKAVPGWFMEQHGRAIIIDALVLMEQLAMSI